MEAANDIVELLKIIKDISYKCKTQSYPLNAIHNAMRSFYLLYQKDAYTLEQCMESFLNNIGIIKHNNGNIGKHPKLGRNICKLDREEDSIDAAMVNLSLKESTEAYFTYAFVLGANQKKYTTLLKDLSDTYLRGKDEYPKTL
eukprot:4867826-Ditylum_brightwellii.AAC.1